MARCPACDLYEARGASQESFLIGIQDRDAFGRPKNESIVEQYYERQEQLRARTNDDNYHYDAGDPASRWDFLGSMKSQMDEAIKTDRMKPSEAMRLLDDYERGLKAYTYLSF